MLYETEDATTSKVWALTTLAALVAVIVTTSVAWRVEYSAWDLEVSLWVQQYDLGPFQSLRGWLFWMGIRGVAGAIMVASLVFLMLRRRRLDALFLGLIGIPDVFNIWLRYFIGHPRPTPDLVEVLGGPQGAGFPSGHALHVVLFYGFLLYLAERHALSRWLVWTLRFLFVLYVLATGVWLIHDGRHWLTDVLGGYAYGAFYLLVLIAGHRWALRTMHDGARRGLALLVPRAFANRER